MGDILFQYVRPNLTTWAYLSSLLSIALFFKFSRFWSVRNLDLILIILLAPGLLCIKHALTDGGEDAYSVEMFGYIWLFSANGLLLLRMLLDSAMVRRPMLEPNLTFGGLSFLLVSLLLFLTANVLTGKPEAADITTAQRAEHLGKGETSKVEKSSLERLGPGFPLVFLLPHISTQTVLGDRSDQPSQDKADPEMASRPQEEGSTEREEGPSEQGAPSKLEYSTGQKVTARVMAILSQFMIVLGIVMVATRHFENAQMGIAAATLYLMLPYTAIWMGSSIHALPGALLVWAVFWYRRPLIAGALIGGLCGTIYYPIYLLPLWIAFYWNRGLPRFLIGFGFSMLLLVVTLVFTSVDDAGFDRAIFVERLTQMFGLWLPRMDSLAGAWNYWDSVYRWPVIATQICLSVSFLVWPSQKNLGTLLCCSSALMIGTQFWHAHSGGGMSLAWYLPLFLLTVFRPNLEDRVAMEVVYPSPWSRKKAE